MFDNRSMRIIFPVTLLFVALTLSIYTVSAQNAPPPPVPQSDGKGYLVNPKPGVAARDTSRGRTVTTTRGYGDAYFYLGISSSIYFSGVATTWLNNYVSNPHTICARVSNIQVNGRSLGGNPDPSCNQATGGASITNEKVAAALCNDQLGVLTEHSIYRPFKFDWAQGDSDFATKCQ